MFVTIPNLVFASNAIVVIFAFGTICDVACVPSVALAFNAANVSNYV